MKLIALSLALTTLVSVGSAAKILVVFPFPGKSHSILGEGIVRHLGEAGHEVTFVTPFKPMKQLKNTRVIDVSSVAAVFYEKIAGGNLMMSILDKTIDMNAMGPMLELLNSVGELVLGDQNFQKLLNDPEESFDLIIIEWMFTDLFSGLQAVFGCPYIWFSSVDAHSAVTQLIDETLNPAYTADIFSTETPPYDFVSRVRELFRLILGRGFGEYFYYANGQRTYEKHLVPIIKKRGREVPSLDVLRFNASLLLGNSHASISQATRLPQNYKLIGGYHIDVNGQPLTEELKKIMDSAKNGVIYFSLGSNIKSSDFPDEMKRDLIKLFGELDYTVLWKFEDVDIEMPKNVHILKWAPQSGILAHPNCKLFITHGGLLSTTEAVHFGVPLIGIPIYGDQFINIRRAESKGYAIKVDLSYSLAKDIRTAIKEFTSTPKYTEKVKELSMIYHDRPVPPGQELVHWVEHVVRTRGAPHLRSPALLLAWYQKCYLDFGIVLLAALFTVYYSFRRLCSALCWKKKVDEKKYN